MKTCSKCKEEKTADQFYKNKSRSDGLGHYCKVCDKKKVSTYLKTEDGSSKQRVRHRKLYQKRVSQDPDYNKNRHLSDMNKVWRRYSDYKKRAALKELEFSLTQDQFEELTSCKCWYCDEHSKDKNNCGIDRVDSDLGYVLENCVPCCKTCNYFKRKMLQEDFLNKVKKIYEHRVGPQAQ